MKPLVSIITPCYNGEKFLDRYFESILAQTYDNLELIFVNDGSEDRTEEIALAYSEKLENKGIRYIYKKQQNAGQAAALNKGLQIFSGEYLTWPDSDDVMTPDCIEKKVRFLENNLDYGMVRSNGVYYDESTGKRKRLSDSSTDTKEDIFEELLLLKTFGCCGCYMVRRSLFDSIYPEHQILDSRCGQNWQILVPAASNTKCGYINEELYIVYENINSHSRKIKTKEENIKRWDDFTYILLDAIEHSNCDKQKYKRMVNAACAREQLYYAIYYKDKQLMREKFSNLKRYGKVKLNEYIVYIKHMYFEKEKKNV